MKIIKGKVIRIVDKRTVIINLGKEHGVKNDAIFSIMGDPEQIIDPYTHDLLGEVKIVKCRVKAKEVAEKFSIATTRWTSSNFKIFNTFIGNIQKNIEVSEVDEGELNVSESEIQPWKAKSESPVKVGDLVQVEIEEVANKEKKLIKNQDKSEGENKEEKNDLTSQ
ncbi:hypothetical protein [Desulfobulbus propionicus]